MANIVARGLGAVIGGSFAKKAAEVEVKAPDGTLADVKVPGLVECKGPEQLREAANKMQRGLRGDLSREGVKWRENARNALPGQQRREEKRHIEKKDELAQTNAFLKGMECYDRNSLLLESTTPQGEALRSARVTGQESKRRKKEDPGADRESSEEEGIEGQWRSVPVGGGKAEWFED